MRKPAKQKPKPYPAHLAISPSPLRPHVLARHRLRLWRPSPPPTSPFSSNELPTIAQADIDRLFEVLTFAWDESTQETYSTGLLVYHAYCDERQVPEHQRAPAHPLLIETFIAGIAGSYSGGTIQNYVAGVRAWHILHSQSWKMDPARIRSLAMAAEKLTPPSSIRKKRRPWTTEFLSALRAHLDLTNPLHAAFYACATTTFWTCARLGEFTVKRVSDFNPAEHVKPSDVKEVTDRHGLVTTSFSIPKTKMGKRGETLAWARQNGDVDPKAALEHHLALNEPPPDGPLFAYKTTRSSRHTPLTKPKFLKVMAEAAKAAGLDPLEGHGIRIGSTLEYLLRGLDFAAVMVIGRWASENAFHLYLCKHAQILAPYLQANPELHTNIVQCTIPRIRRPRH